MKTLRDLVQATQLHAIDIVRNAAWRLDMTQIGEALDHRPAQLEAHVEVSTPPVSREGWLTFLVSIRGRLTRDGTEVGQLEASVRLAYQFSGTAPPDALVNAFGESLAVHHAWPYLREKVHTLGMGIGFHLAPLPLRRLGAGLE